MNVRERFGRTARMARRDDKRNWCWRHTATCMRGTYLGPHTDFLPEYLKRLDRRLLQRETWVVPTKADRVARVEQLKAEMPGSIPADQAIIVSGPHAGQPAHQERDR